MLSILLSLSMIAQSAGEVPPASSVISALPARCVGFGTQGRMGPLAVYEKDNNIFYASSCNGGVLKTTDGGERFEFVFDKQGSANIGALAVSQKDPKIVWVGTGDAALRLGVGRGDGIYKSIDGGRTWQHMGLENSHTIGKIVIDPRNDNVVFVAALGDTWGYNKDRGIYKTKDGGKTWKKVLYLDERSSGNDVIIDPKNPNNMLASLWDKVHKAYGWFESGPGSGIYRSTNGGETWKKITAGLPTEKVGRICMDYFRKDPNYVAAIIQEPAPLSRTFTSKDGGKTWQRRKGAHIGYDNKPVKDNLRDGGVPVWYRAYYNHVMVYDPNDVNTFYYGAMRHVTKDGGDTWTGGASDVHALWISPDGKVKMEADDNTVHRNGRAMVFPSVDQMYGIGYDMRKLYWVSGSMQDQFGLRCPTQTIYGSVSALDALGGPGDEGGKTMADPNDWTTWYIWSRCLSFWTKNIRTDANAFGKFPPMYNYSDQEGYEKYLKQDLKLRASWTPGGAISPWNSHVIYYGANYLFKSSDRGMTFEIISPDLTHNNPELAKPDDGKGYHGDPADAEGVSSRSYQTIRAIAESPMKPGMIWVGTDDGYVHLTQDNGKNWTNLTKNIPGIPDYCWCSHVYPSRFSEGRCYVTFDNHRNNDMTTYVYVTEDYGKTWSKITGNLPKKECCFVIKEGLKNPNLLYLGTEYGLWISLDRGKSWDRYQDYKVKDTYNPRHNYFPTVAIFDLEIHPRELDLIIACHGRGAWIMPARALEEMTPENRAKDVYLCSPGNVYLFPREDRGDDYERPWTDHWKPGIKHSDNTQPGTLICYYLKQDAKSVKIEIKKAGGEDFDPVRNEYDGKMRVPKVELSGATTAGLNAVKWMPMPKRDYRFINPGDYRVILTVDGKEYTQTLHVEDATDEVMPGGKALYPRDPKRFQEQMARKEHEQEEIARRR